MRVLEVERADFLERRWRYQPGEHVTFLAPTQWGKTTLAGELLARSASPRLPAVVLVMKPRDKVVRQLGRKLEYPIVRSWPPPPSIWRARRPSGRLLWPRHTFDPDRDDPMLARQFRAALLDSYKRGNRIVVADETYGLCEELDLDRYLIALWSRGASMGCGLWGMTQKPSHIPLWAYSQPEHIFIGHDPDRRARDRFAEIGGVDPVLVQRTVMGLKKYHWLYIRRTGPAMCVIGP